MTDTALKASSQSRRYRVEFRGAVQGVGFRPYIFRRAQQLGLNGWVRNTTRGLALEIEGAQPVVRDFLATVTAAAPAQAWIEDTTIDECPTDGQIGFAILASDSQAELGVVPVPDLAVCDDCLREIFDPCDRRYRYPFANCTACGPRYSIMDALPYDRANTSMASFSMCPDCAHEYADPNDRRFHAQPNACPKCGPQLTLWDRTGGTIANGDAALLTACELIRGGQILAVKGIGGFHLLCDTSDESTVGELRRRKQRPDKPFAMMWPDLNTLLQFCVVNSTERELLASVAAPIVLLKRRPLAAHGLSIAPNIAPGNPYLGVMLPSTPLHHLLLDTLGAPVVATSGNLSNEPIAIDETEAVRRLAGIADAFLIHDRPIRRPVEDSIVRVIANKPAMLRRARGYAPLPLTVSGMAHGARSSILALGAHSKNTLALAEHGRTLLAPHIGDLETPQAIDAFDDSIAGLAQLFDARPELVACDLHPDYVSSSRAKQMDLPIVRVQHHVAHVAACMAEHELVPPLLGIAWDGTGYGCDGTLWGGEFLEIGKRDFKRLAHLATFPLCGGAVAIKQPRRSALGVLWQIFGEDMWNQRDLAPIAEFQADAQIVTAMLTRGLNAPLTSSVGRLFDAVAALLGYRQTASYEGQAAAELEWAAEGADGSVYPFALVAKEQYGEFGFSVDWRPMIVDILREVRANTARGVIARRFHNTLSEIIVQVAEVSDQKKVVLSGGCFQNKLLTELSVQNLEARGFEPYWHSQVPANDGGIALGQVRWAQLQLEQA